jgi:hypothetical protein
MYVVQFVRKHHGFVDENAEEIARVKYVLLQEQTRKIDTMYHNNRHNYTPYTPYTPYTN